MEARLADRLHHVKPSRANKVVRVCERCGTKLSVYNKGKACWAHSPQKYPKVRAPRGKA